MKKNDAESQAVRMAEKRQALQHDLDLDERRRIRVLLDKPMNRRTNFLRKRLPNGGSCL